MKKFFSKLVIAKTRGRFLCLVKLAYIFLPKTTHTNSERGNIKWKKKTLKRIMGKAQKSLLMQGK